MMFKSKYAGSQLLSRDKNNTDVCRLSTVDRFQGDEEDIIICSLVVDEKSKTAFVKLVNRMIVLLSRARLGMYLLGNVAYFEKEKKIPAHWEQTLQALKEGGSDDTLDSILDSKEVYLGPRVGEELPLCCPAHRSVTMAVSSPSSLSLGFCSQICTSTLDCGHPCSLKCHWPKETHNRKCKVQLDSPCDLHGGKIECNQLYANAPGASKAEGFESALSFYRCPHMVDLTLPCNHVIQKRCWEKTKISAGDMVLPECHEQSPTPYIFTNCGHDLPVTCYELDQYQNDPSLVQCKRLVKFTPPCGHSKNIECSKAQKFNTGSRVYRCDEKRTFRLPRCGHEQKLLCHQAQQIEQWTGKACDVVGTILEGVSYGSQDYQCKKQATVVRKCGHKFTLPCCQAFSQVNNLGPCHEKIQICHPICGHPCDVDCSVASTFQDIEPSEIVQEYVEGQIDPVPSIVGYVPPCKLEVSLKRKCGHTVPIQCSQVRKPLDGCKEKIKVTSPLCGHSIDIQCHLRTDFKPDMIWAKSTFEMICSETPVPMYVGHKCVSQSFSSKYQSVLHQCQKATLVTLPCGHESRIKCNSLLSSFESNSTASICDEEVTLQLSCNHNIRVACSKAQQYKAGNETIECLKTKSQKCWNHNMCGRSIVVPCGFEGTVACNKEILWECKSKPSHKYTWNFCQEGIPDACPGCSLERLRTDTIHFLDNEVVDTLQSFLTWLPQKAMNIIDSGKQKGTHANEKELLRRHCKLCDHQDLLDVNLFQKPLLEIQRVPIFRKLQERNLDIDQFNPNRFPPKLHGLMVRLFSETNIRKLADSFSDKKQTHVLLVGYATVLKTYTQSQKLPKKKWNFVKSLWKQNYDSLAYTDPTKDLDTIIIWEPFPVQSVFCVEVTTEQLYNLAEKLDDFSLSKLSPRNVFFTKPNDLTLDAGVNEEIEDDEDSCTDERNEELQRAFHKTILEGLNVNVSWVGGFDSGGAIQSHVEKKLLDNMQFVNKSSEPFQAISLLESLLPKKPQCHILELLMAAELVQYSPENAQTHFSKYVEAVKSAGEIIHPWAIVVAARLETEFTKQLLSVFQKLFPMHDALLSPEELKEMQDKDTPESEGKISWSEKLKDEWAKIQAKNSTEARSEAMEELLNLEGLRKVKEEALRLWQTALQLNQMGAETRKQNLFAANYCFLGNPGTGKTTVARLFAKILCDTTIRKSKKIVEVTAQEAKDNGMDEFRKTIQKAMGGVLFIDEAYSIDPIGDYKGKPIVNELLTLCEDKRDKISVILAGYEDDFEEKFFKYNEGLKSRFRNVYFEDFDSEELSKIWNSMRNKKDWREEDGVCGVVVRRMTKMAGRKGFGNAREVRRRLEEATQGAMSRLGLNFSEENMELLIEDVIGEDPRLFNEKLERVIAEIDEKIGWKRIKASVDELVKLCGVNYHLELAGKPTLPFLKNRMFLGNPGTGKTTCAKLYRRLLKELSFLSNGGVVIKTASDFVGSVIGESQTKTSQILDGARGKVLVIDEAYNLDDSLYGKQILDTIVEKVQGQPDEDLAVLLLGYEEPMLEMIRNQNPGLSRRFPKEQAFYFDDYSGGELLKILELNLKKNGATASLEFKKKVLKILKKQKQQSNFGNAGSVEQIVVGAMQKASERLDGEKVSQGLVLEDVDVDELGSARAEKDEDPLSVFDKLYRMDEVKAKLEKMRMSWDISRQDGDEEMKIGHFVFTGSPGTGKTTVARAIADVLYSLGLLPSNKIKETSALDLTADYLGQTKTKVNEALKAAKGGILFIDEAYNLGIGPYGKEACDAIVAAMTSTEFQDVVVVIAGYPKEIDDMLQSNSGLKSRFTHFFEFPDWERQDCKSFFELLCQKKNFVFDEGVLESVEEGCSQLMKLNGWGNGRDVTKLFEETKSNRDVRVFKSNDDTVQIDRKLALSDVKNAINTLLASRRPKTNDKPKRTSNFHNYSYDLASGGEHVPQLEEKINVTENENTEKGKSSDDVTDQENSNAGSVTDEHERDDGVSDEIWNELQNSKQREKILNEELMRLKEQAEELQKVEMELQRQYEEEMERIDLELQRQREEEEKAEQERLEEERHRRQEEERKRRERTEVERRRREEEIRKAMEELRRLEAIKEKLRQLSPCPAGFTWHQCSDGWRCAGGSHFVSDEELRRNFTY